MNDTVTLTPEEIAQLREERDRFAAERDHERAARLEEARRADGLSTQVSHDRRNLIGAQVANLQAQAHQAKAAVEGITAEIGGLRSQIASLNEEGKFAEAAELQEKMGDATARRQAAQQAQTYYAQQAEAAKSQPADPIDAFFARNPNFNDGEREWIRKNPRYATDDAFRNRVNQAHSEAAAANIQPGSTEYFEKLEQAGYMRQAPRPQARQEAKPQQQTEGDEGAGSDDSPLSSAAGETDLDTGGTKVDTAPPRPSGAAAPSRRSPSTPPARRGLTRKLTPDEADAALAMSEYFPEDVQNGGEAAIYAHYADLKDNHPVSKRLREEWASR